MTAIGCFLCCAVGFTAGVLVGMKSPKEKKPPLKNETPPPETVPLPEEYRNFLHYDGTCQR